MELLKDVIKKYESGEAFGLRIQLLDKDEGMVDPHALKMANVFIQIKYSDEKMMTYLINISYCGFSRNWQIFSLRSV